MESRPVKVPGPDHPITIEKGNQRVIVKVGEHTIADTRDALVLREASYPPVFYLPRKAVKMELLQKTAHSTYCPYKGDCSYFTIPAGGEKSINAVWTYETPFPAAEQIKDHLAFYPNRVDLLKIDP